MASTICFYARFEDSDGDGTNGLTVTWDVERITRADGTRAALVTGGANSITVGRRGLYGYVLTSADIMTYDYVATAITASATPTSHEVAAIWTLWSMSDYLDAKVSTIAAAIAATGALPAAGDLLDIVKYTTYNCTITGMTISAGWTWFIVSIKEDLKDSDDDALLRVKVTNGGAAGDGLLRINKQAPTDAGLTAADASLTIDQVAGTCAIYVTDAATTELSAARSLGYDAKENDGTDTALRSSGMVNIKATETQAT